MEPILAILALAVVVLVFIVRAIHEQRPPVQDLQPFSYLAGITYTESLLDDDGSDSGEMSEREVAELVRQCIANHNAMTCVIRAQGEYLLPLSINGERISAMPLDVAPNEEPRCRTYRLSSIRKPQIETLKIAEWDLEFMHLALKHSIPISVDYLDESGEKWQDEEFIPLHEEGDFFLCGSEDSDSLTKIRAQWIEGVRILPFAKWNSKEPQLEIFVRKLLASTEWRVRLEGLHLSDSLGDQQHIATLLRLAKDPSAEVRGAVADATRRHTCCIHKTVLRESYTFLDVNQDPRMFQLLETLARDGAPTVRMKAAYALGDHPSEKTAAILDRLRLDHDEQVQRAADHAKKRLADYSASGSAYESAVREKASIRARRRAEKNISRGS